MALGFLQQPERTFRLLRLCCAFRSMSEFDIDAFITELERLGVKLTTIRLPDGTYRVNRWRMPDAIMHAEQIERLWATHIGDSKSRMMLLATHLARRLPNRSSSGT
jgi:hypothetical protein